MTCQRHVPPLALASHEARPSPGIASPGILAHTSITCNSARILPHTLHVYLSRLPAPHSHAHTTWRYQAPLYWARDEKAVAEKAADLRLCHARQPHHPRCASCGAFAMLAPPPATRPDAHKSLGRADNDKHDARRHVDTCCHGMRADTCCHAMRQLPCLSGD
jgi:hypothetical protein